ncbi:hypothetical protein M2306_002069 [Myroides gitamensis]|nr:hypothetical protein Myrod_2636 [Myroides odoratus DSM 2801]EKB06124.1 hypothetical protein HMPREF9716_02500 [Myroides odoratus CIP 103059]MDH6601375.1 hypothetical protein [Myroides gitamensis]STZ30736.1 Uncharacterised protein [Myroides odoratus]
MFDTENDFGCMKSQQLGRTLNKLRRYQLILDLYNEHKTPDIPVSVVWRKYIYPVYPISRTTLYEVLGTAVHKELMRVEEECKQLNLL